MAPRVKLFIPLFLFVALALFLFRGLQLDPTELPSALIDRPLPAFELPARGFVEIGRELRERCEFTILRQSEADTAAELFDDLCLCRTTNA